MLLNEIAQNRHRLQSILTRLDDAKDAQDIVHILKQITLEELISCEQC